MICIWDSTVYIVTGEIRVPHTQKASLLRAPWVPSLAPRGRLSSVVLVSTTGPEAPQGHRPAGRAAHQRAVGVSAGQPVEGGVRCA